MELNKIKNMDCLDYLKEIPDNSVDLVVTDPPYSVSQKQNLKFNDRTIVKNFGDWDFEQKLFLKKEEQSLLDTYGFNTIDDVLEYLKYEHKEILNKKTSPPKVDGP